MKDMTKNELKYFIEAKGIETHFNNSLEHSIMFIEHRDLIDFSKLLGTYDSEDAIDCVLLERGCIGLNMKSLIDSHLQDEFESTEEAVSFLKSLESD